MKYIYKVFILLSLTLLIVACNGRQLANERTSLDSLNLQSYINRYKNIDSTYNDANSVFSSPYATSLQKAIAINTLGFVAFIDMDYDRASYLYGRVNDITSSELERFVSDVGMMRICQRTSQNEAFFDYRNSAFKRLKRLREEMPEFEIRENFRMNYAQSEFHLVSAIYYKNFHQQEKMHDELDMIYNSEDLQRDTTQWLYFTYMRGLGMEASVEQDNEPEALTKFIHLNNCLETSREGGYLWFEAASLQALAELFLDKNAIDIVQTRRPNAFKRLSQTVLSNEQLPVALAEEALRLFLLFGDGYKVIDTYCTLATCLNIQEDNYAALMTLDEALELINDYHFQRYSEIDSLSHLNLYEPEDSIELLWIDNKNVTTIPELLLRIREQISASFSGLGDKEASDYNRNVYLDLLARIRQNSEYESRANQLEQEAATLNLFLIFAVVGLILIIMFLYFIGYNWQKRNKKYIRRLRVVLAASKQISSAIPNDVTNNEQVVTRIVDMAQPYIKQLFGDAELKVKLESDFETEDSPNIDKTESEKKVTSFPLWVPDKGKSIGTLQLYSLHTPTRDERAVLQVLIPYFAVAIENGLTFVDLGDEYRRIEKEHYLYQRHVAENKRENVIKKTCFALVNGITPYMDRIVNEVYKLQSQNLTLSEEEKKEKYIYINELTDKINEYNNILAQWIKMRQGTFNLHIETFSLSSLFVTLSKSRQTFESRRLKLTVEPTDILVKADKALTLFMINTLAENARKYTPSGGSVTISALESPDYVEISVTDTGVGLSQVDIARILGEKVYDSRLIGSDNEKAEEIKKNKGNGFGILNCKGIIEKYRKTDTLFKVCRFGIESKQGSGSRFFFRLPKGVKRVLCLILLFSMTSNALLHANDYLSDASSYAEIVYESNLNGDYEQAILYADSTLQSLNAFYMAHCKEPKGELKLHQSETAAELDWWRQGFEVDSLKNEIYYNLLDIRNEVAIASLALRLWDDYHYNNNIYWNLYRIIHEDSSLAEYCDSMQRASNNKQIAIVLCILFLLIVLIIYYLFYFRQWLVNRINLRQTLEINKQLFASSLLSPQEANDTQLISSRIVHRIFNGMNDLLSIRLLCVAIFDDEQQQLKFSYYPEEPLHDWFTVHVPKCYETEKEVSSADETMFCLPLISESGDVHRCVGVMAYTLNGTLQESERLMGELVANYVGIVVYNTIVKLAHKYRDIEQMQDDARRAVHEENKLHVQNQVLDNCLSVIKHETVYYPNRIKQIVSRLIETEKTPVINEKEQIASISELIGYYKDIFTTLSQCAARQLEDITFRRSNISVKELLLHAEKYLKNKVSQLAVEISMETTLSDENVIGDTQLLYFLLDNLIDAALTNTAPGKLLLSTLVERNFVRFNFTDTRRHVSVEEASLFFAPSIQQIRSTEEGHLTGIEYLLCKQIVREHDEYIGHRGCRINVCEGTEGCTVWFMIPKKNN